MQDRIFEDDDFSDEDFAYGEDFGLSDEDYKWLNDMNDSLSEM